MDKSQYLALFLQCIASVKAAELPMGAHDYLPFDYLAADNTSPGGSLVGTASGNVSIVTGILGNAMFISGETESNLYLGEWRDSCFWSPGLCTQGYTVAFWLKIGPKAGSELYYLSNGGHTYASYGISFNLAPGPQVRYLIKTNSRWYQMQCDVTKGTWLHFALSWSAGNGSKSFLNGERCDEDAAGDANERETSDSNGFYFGKPNTNVGSADKGGEATYDELLFWQEEKTEDFMQSLYDSYQQPFGNGPMIPRKIIVFMKDNQKLFESLGSIVTARNALDCTRKCFLADDLCLTAEWTASSNQCRLSNVIANGDVLTDTTGTVVYGKYITLQ